MSAPPRPGNIDMMAASLAATIQTGVSPVGPPPSLTKPEPPDEPPAPGAPPEPTAPLQAAAPRSMPQLPPGMGFPAIHAEPRVALPQVPPMQQHAPPPGQTAGPHAPPQGPPQPAQPPQPPAQPPPEHPTPTPPVPAPDPPAAAEPISPEEKKSLASGSSSRKPKGQGGVSRNGPAWTEQEDAQIMQLVSVHGRKWKIIAESIPNRTHDALRNRYERLLKLTENGGSRANGHAASESADGKQHIPPGAANFVPASADMNQVLAIECIIPDAHREAQPLCWPSPSGVLVEVSVPPGARPGQTLRFHIPSWLAADLGHKVGPHPSQPPATGRVSPGASAPRKRPHDEVAPPVPMPPAGSMPPQGMPQPAALLAGAGPAGAMGGAPPGALDAMMDASGPMDPMGMGDQLASSAAGAGPLGLAAGAGSASGLSDADGQGSCYPGEPPSSLAPMGADEDEDAPLPGTESLMEMEMEAHHEPGPAGE